MICNKVIYTKCYKNSVPFLFLGRLGCFWSVLKILLLLTVFFCILKTCSCCCGRYFGMLFWDNITILRDENLLLFTFFTGKLRKNLFWTNKKFVPKFHNIIPKWCPKISSRQHEKVFNDWKKWKLEFLNILGSGLKIWYDKTVYFCFKVYKFWGQNRQKHTQINCVRQSQESRREGWTDAAIMLCKLNKNL